MGKFCIGKIWEKFCIGKIWKKFCIGKTCQKFCIGKIWKTFFKKKCKSVEKKVLKKWAEKSESESSSSSESETYFSTSSLYNIRLAILF